VHLLESWSEFSQIELIRWFLPVICATALVVLPGRRVARVGAAAMAVSLLITPGYVAGQLRLFGWVLLWAFLAWWLGRPPANPASPVRRLGFLEAGAVGLLLGLALFALLGAALARQGLAGEEGRRALLGLLLLCLGMLHLMMRGHATRSALAFAILGLGLREIQLAAQRTLLPDSGDRGTGIFAATVIAVGLALRIGRTRETVATSPWVGDAHDLHD
jgi:hypothetical protein